MNPAYLFGRLYGAEKVLFCAHPSGSGAGNEVANMARETGEKMKGKGEELKGKAKTKVGEVTGNEKMQGEGMVEEAKGKTRQSVADAKRKIKKAA